MSLRKTKLGPILVNSRGHTLYLFAKDRNGKSACYSALSRTGPFRQFLSQDEEGLIHFRKPTDIQNN